MGGGTYIGMKSAYIASSKYATITAPVNTYSGDLMVCVILHDTTSMNTEQNLDGFVEPFPTGWIQAFWYRYRVDPPYVNGGRRWSVFFKVATDDDENEESYTWTRDDGYLVGKIWIMNMTFRGIAAYGGSTNHNMTNWSRIWSNTRTKSFSSTNGLLAPRQADNRLLIITIVNRYGLEGKVPTIAASGNEWFRTCFVREGTLSSSHAVSVATTTGSPTTGLLQMPTIPTQTPYTSGLYTTEYETLLLELVTTENALILDPPPPVASSRRKPILTEEQKLEQMANRSRYIEYSKSHRSNIYLPVDRAYNRQRGYKNTPIVVRPLGR
jgi:hypothetical protein